MKIGVPKEIKPQENRIGLTPESVKTLASNGHQVLLCLSPRSGQGAQEGPQRAVARAVSRLPTRVGGHAPCTRGAQPSTPPHSWPNQATGALVAFFHHGLRRVLRRGVSLKNNTQPQVPACAKTPCRKGYVAGAHQPRGK